MNMSISNLLLFLKKVLFIILIAALFKFAFLFDPESSFLAQGVYGPSNITVLLFSGLLTALSVNKLKLLYNSVYIKSLLLMYLYIVLLAINTANDVIQYIGIYSTLVITYASIVMYIDSTYKLTFLTRLLQIFCILTCSIVLIQAYVINNGGNPFLYIYFYNSGIYYSWRDGLFRVVENDLIYIITYCISLEYLFSAKKTIYKILGAICSLTVLTYYLYVGLTRQYIIVLIFLLLFRLLYRRRFKTNMVISFLALSLVIPFFFYNYIVTILDKISITTQDYSFVHRIGGYIFFLQNSINDLLLGFGFRNVDTIYYVNDIGIIGIFAQFGIIVFLLYIINLILNFKIIRRLGSMQIIENMRIAKNILAFYILLLFLLPSLDPTIVKLYVFSLSLLNSISKYRIEDFY